MRDSSSKARRALSALGGFALLGVLAGVTACASSTPKPTQAPRCASATEQAEAKLRTLTLDEKLSLVHGATTMMVAGIPEKGIEPLHFSDNSSTVRAEMHTQSFGNRLPDSDTSDTATVFPALTALASTWDEPLARRFGEAMGEQARARGKDVMLGPGLNIARTPLCGRNWEYLGEDPTLTSRLAVNIVQGMLSKDVAACVKHFAANSQELNRYGVDSCPDERTLREIYFPAFEAAVKEGGALVVMNGYNRLYGEFCSHNPWLNKGVLEGEWGFPGLVVTDWGGLHDTVKGVKGGTDIEMNGGAAIRYFKKPLKDAVKSGEVSEEDIDRMVRRILYVHARLHKLDGKPRAPGSRNTPEHQALAREIAAAGTTLLKNDGAVLPLDPAKLKRVLVVGRNADQKHCREGWSAEGKPPYEITPLEGLKRALPNAEITYAPFPEGDASAALPDSVIVTENPNVLADVGMRDRGWTQQRFANDKLSGKPKTSFVRAPSVPKGTTTPNFSMRWETQFRAPEEGPYSFTLSYDDGARLFLDGKPLVDDWGNGAQRTSSREIRLKKGAVYTLRAEYRQAGGDAIFALGWTLPSERGATIRPLIEQAKQSDAVILFTGSRHGHGRALECENGDLPSIDLLEQDNAAIPALLGVCPKTIVVVNAGTPFALPWVNRTRALLLTCYGGQEAGNALADVLLGKRDPGGRLPFTWLKDINDSPAHKLKDYNPKQVFYKEGVLVGYRWFDAKGILPLFPFGYGLSYASFALGKPEATTAEDGTVTVRVPVTNTSSRPGSTVVQGYVERPAAGYPEPSAPRRLGAFAKVHLKPGETQTAILTFKPRAFAYWDSEQHAWTSPAGIHVLDIGFSSADLPERVTLEREAWVEPVPTVAAPDMPGAPTTR